MSPSFLPLFGIAELAGSITFPSFHNIPPPLLESLQTLGIVFIFGLLAGVLLAEWMDWLRGKKLQADVWTRLNFNNQFDRLENSVEKLLGPHEWGYRDPVIGGFIHDDAPFNVGADILTIIEQFRGKK